MNVDQKHGALTALLFVKNSAITNSLFERDSLLQSIADTLELDVDMFDDVVYSDSSNASAKQKKDVEKQ